MAPKRSTKVTVKTTRKVVKESAVVAVVPNSQTTKEDTAIKTIPIEQKTEEQEEILSNIEQEQPQSIVPDGDKAEEDNVSTEQEREQSQMKKILPTEEKEENQTQKSSQVQQQEQPTKDYSETVKKGKLGTKKEEEKRKAKTKEGLEKGEKKVRKKRRKVEIGGGEEYKRYVFRVLKQVHPGMEMSSKAMTILNNLMTDMFERLAFEAAKLSKYTERKTLSAREIQGAVKLVLPGELGRHAIAEGTKAVTTYMSNDDAK